MRRNDAMTLDEVAALAPSHIILSPGPCTPREAGISIDARPPLRADDADPRRVPRPSVHRRGLRRATSCAPAGRCTARRRPSRTTAPGIFAGLPSPLRGGALSLARHRAARRCRRSLRVIATADDDGEIMAVEHRDASGDRRAVPSRVGGERVRLRDARSLPARRAVARHGACRRAPTTRASRRGRSWWRRSIDNVPGGEFVPPPVELVR